MPSKTSDLFSRASRWTSWAMGTPAAFIVAMASVFAWAACGPMLGYSSDWLVFIGSFTSVIAFLMVFLIQNTQNRHSAAIQIKLDELIRAVAGAHNVLVDLENASDEQLARIKDQYRHLAEVTRENTLRGQHDTGTPRVDVPVEEPPKGPGRGAGATEESPLEGRAEQIEERPRPPDP
jgi:low affinity Fe/Cu permease